MLRRALLLVVLAGAGVLVAPAGVAWADGGGGVTVSCSPGDASPGCVLSAQTPGGQGSAVVDSVHPQPGSAGGTQVCRDWAGYRAPCVDPFWGWMGSDGCYYKVDPTWKPQPWDTADQPPPGQAGAYYDFACISAHAYFPGTGGGIAWLPAGTAPGGPPPPPPPVVLARQATNRLSLHGPAIAANPAPNAEQMVSLPTWLWLAGGWAPVSATAAVPGESVTATATPTRVVWSMGDGSSVVCHGPGTPYPAGSDPNAASPTCSHTYTVSSAGQAGGAFPVSATVTWSIGWAGGGQTGTLPALTTTSEAAFRVAETQAVNTAPGA